MHADPWLFDLASSGRIRVESSLRSGTDDHLVHVDVDWLLRSVHRIAFPDMAWSMSVSVGAGIMVWSNA
jgi:hypothetical protein